MSPQVAADILRLVDEFSPPTVKSAADQAVLDAAAAIADAKNLTEQIRLLGPLTTAVTDARRAAT